MLTRHRAFNLPSNTRETSIPSSTFWAKALTLWIGFSSTFLFPTLASAGTETAIPDWCSNYRLALTDDANSGRVVLQTSLIANIRLPVPVNPVKATLYGIGDKSPTITSKLQCANLVIFDQVPPGEYRVQSIEGSVNIAGAPARFLNPMNNAYQIIGAGAGSTAIYRVTVPRNLDATVKVTAGETSYAGYLSTDAKPNSPWGFTVNWDHQPTTQATICQAFNQAYTLTGSCKLPE
ncbi:MAG: hypothetical protein DRQ60_00265 [Gammaproteobacteria bacterium]|nr:MAG: hypothetical protein DRQ60_00265 [Gammaproteobacteria bacterium]